MVIGIDASRAFLRNRTGIEEYSYQTIAHLRIPLKEDRVMLYVQDGQTPDFELPQSWKVRSLRSPRFWTHVRLSLEMLLHRPDVLFVPAHTIPFIHPARNVTLLNRLSFVIVQKFIHPFTGCKKTHSVAGGPAKSVVTVHGLEYEFSRESYSRWERFYMRAVIRFSCKSAETIVAVSENTKRDLIRLYGVSAEKIRVVYEGRPKGLEIRDNFVRGPVHEDERADNSEQRTGDGEYERLTTDNVQLTTRERGLKREEESTDKPYLLFVGRIEERKNVRRIVEAYGLLKKRHGIPHRLVLAGKPGYGYADVKRAIGASEYRSDIVETGYVDESKKSELLAGADVFVFPSLYEGFGLPVVEAQTVGVPVVTSEISSLPDIAGDGALFADPLSAESIADRIWELLSDPVLRGGIIGKGRQNAERFDWGRCAEEIAELLQS